MNKRLARLLIGSILLAPIFATPATTHAASPRSLPPCANEDASGGPIPCLWNATTRGNLEGSSFWVDKRGHFHYIPDAALRTR